MRETETDRQRQRDREAERGRQTETKRCHAVSAGKSNRVPIRASHQPEYNRIAATL